MRNFIAGVALVSLSVLWLVTVLPAQAVAETREFVGQVVKISDKKIVVSNRMQDKMDFIRGDATAVQGSRTSWKAIQEKDRVTVTWDVADKPRKAYQIMVMPPERSSDGD